MNTNLSWRQRGVESDIGKRVDHGDQSARYSDGAGKITHGVFKFFYYKV